MEWIDEGLEILSEEQCTELLGEAGVGRVGITIGALPVVLPINYGVLDGDIVFATTNGTKLDAAVRNAVIAFEVDAIDELAQDGWSVLVVGTAHEVTDEKTIERIGSLGVRPWVGGQRDRWVRIERSVVTGRRIVSDGEDSSAAS
jgi:nitroimidazol reductase NimA-like FMN-containing flavoprotein (pyridoxamine 5'-phosphate oxidase superfamily)